MSDDDDNLPAKMASNLPTAGPGLTVKFLGQRFSQFQETNLAKAQARLIDAYAEYNTAVAKRGRSMLVLDRQLAENEAYDYEQDKRIHKLRAELEEVELAQQVQDARFEKKLSKKQYNQTLKDKPKKSKHTGNSTKRNFADRAEDILKYGAMGENQKIAEQMIEQLLKEAGVESEEELPPELRSRIEELRREALREDQSKGG